MIVGDYHIDGTVALSENLVVTGHLTCTSGAVLRFDNIDESNVVDYHGCDPLDTNIGLWLTDTSSSDVDGLWLTATAGRAHTHICGGVHHWVNVNINHFGPAHVGSYPLHV